MGSDLGPAPTEHALQALAACMTTTMVYNCAARGIQVRSVESEVEVVGEEIGVRPLEPLLSHQQLRPVTTTVVELQ